jgi:hypothetical protein
MMLQCPPAVPFPGSPYLGGRAAAARDRGGGEGGVGGTAALRGGVGGVLRRGMKRAAV